MSKRHNPLAVWQHIPVANRTVGAAASVTGAVGSVTGAVGSVTTVNDKTGYSLTAGSYVVRASSTQTANIVIANPAVTATATISSVTVTRAIAAFDGQQSPNTALPQCLTRITLTNATTVTASVATTPATSDIQTGMSVLELF